MAPEIIKCRCDFEQCQSTEAHADKWLTQMPRVLVVVLMRYSTDVFGVSHKRDDMVDIVTRLDMSQFTVGLQTRLPPVWVPKECPAFLPRMSGPRENKRMREDADDEMPGEKRLRLEASNTLQSSNNRSRRTRRNHQRERRSLRVQDLADEQRRLMSRCGGSADAGMLIALSESLSKWRSGSTTSLDPHTFVQVDAQTPQCSYSLRSAIFHHGMNTHNGHYTARVRTQGGWELHNDSEVRDLNGEIVFGDDECKSVYMLLFEID